MNTPVRATVTMPSTTTSGSAELSAALDQESEASVGSEEFRAHKIHPAPRQRDLERAEDHRQGRGDAYGPEKLPVRRAVEPAHLEKDRIGHAHAHIGIDDARHDAADPDDEHLAVRRMPNQ